MIQISTKYPKYNFDIHKGYGTEQHKKLIKKYGPCSLHRQSFLH
jgi:ribonuclease HII